MSENPGFARVFSDSEEEAGFAGSIEVTVPSSSIASLSGSDLDCLFLLLGVGVELLTFRSWDGSSSVRLPAGAGLT